jgi:hypothetical protein
VNATRERVCRALIDANGVTTWKVLEVRFASNKAMAPPSA